MQATTAEGRKVAIKSLSFSGMKDWKQLELFQREARTLASLDHPGIPRCADCVSLQCGSWKKLHFDNRLRSAFRRLLVRGGVVLA